MGPQHAWRCPPVARRSKIADAKTDLAVNVSRGDEKTIAVQTRETAITPSRSMKRPHVISQSLAQAFCSYHPLPDARGRARFLSPPTATDPGDGTSANAIVAGP